MATVLAGCGGESRPEAEQSVSGYVTGSAIEQALAEQLKDSEGNSVFPSCPNERMIVGDTIVCRVMFADGSYKDAGVALTGFHDGGTPEIEIGPP
jgi:hypothetical protein